MNDSKTEAINELNLLKEILNNACVESQQKMDKIFKTEQLRISRSSVIDAEGKYCDFFTQFERFRSNYIQEIEKCRLSLENSIELLKNIN